MMFRVFEPDRLHTVREHGVHAGFTSPTRRRKGDRTVGGVLVHAGCEFVQRAEMPTHAVPQVEPRTDDDFRVVDAGAAGVPPEALPDTVLSYTLPSRFCPSDELGELAWDLFGAIRQGWVCRRRSTWAPRSTIGCRCVPRCSARGSS